VSQNPSTQVPCNGNNEAASGADNNGPVFFDPRDRNRTTGGTPGETSGSEDTNSDSHSIRNSGSAPSSESSKKSKKRKDDSSQYFEKAWKVIHEIERRGGRFVIIDDELVVVETSKDGQQRRWALQRGNLTLDEILEAVAGVTHSEHTGKLIIDRVRILAHKKGASVKHGKFSLRIPANRALNTAEAFVVSCGHRYIRVSADGVKPVHNTQDYYIEAVGDAWKFQKLDKEMRQWAAKKMIWLARSMSCAPQTRLAYTLGIPVLTITRERLDTRPIVDNTGRQGSGKTFGADRQANLLYGRSALETATEAALRRGADPLTILDDIERMPRWLRDHLRRSSTGIRHKSVRTVGSTFGVEDSGPSDGIYIVTGIRIPADSPLLSRTWAFTFDKEHFDPAYKTRRPYETRFWSIATSC
jgi:hypothetical protein